MFLKNVLSPIRSHLVFFSINPEKASLLKTTLLALLIITGAASFYASILGAWGMVFSAHIVSFWRDLPLFLTISGGSGIIGSIIVALGSLKIFKLLELIDDEQIKDENLELKDKILKVFNRHPDEFLFSDNSLTALYVKPVEGINLIGENGERIQLVVTGILVKDGINELYLAHDFKEDKKKVVRILHRLAERDNHKLGTEIHKFLIEEKLSYVIKIYDTFSIEKEELYGIVLKYRPIGDFYDVFDREKIKKREVLHLCAQIFWIVKEMHARKCLHGDLKSENVLLAFRKATESIKSKDSYKYNADLCDFDCACYFDTPAFPVWVRGTLSNLAPEVDLEKIIRENEAVSFETENSEEETSSETSELISVKKTAEVKKAEHSFTPTPQMDVWALGIFLLESLHGQVTNKLMGDDRDSILSRNEAWGKVLVKIEEKTKKEKRENVKKVLQGTLDINPDTRMTAAVAADLLKEWL